MNAWIAAAIATPLLLLLACLWARARADLMRWLPIAPVPALLAALFAPQDMPLRVGHAGFALVFAMDRPGAVLLGVASLLWIAGALHAQREERASNGAFVTAWLMTLTGCVGVFLAADVVGFYFLLAVLSVGAAGLVMQGVRPASMRAAAVYLGVALLAEALLLAALVLLVQASPEGSLMIADAPATLSASTTRGLTLTLLIIGLGMKAALVPMHFWMPLAYGAAPLSAAAVMSGAVVKASVLALVRLLPFDIALPDFGMPLAAVGMLGAFYGVAIGLTQSDTKVVLAYSSVSQMGFVMALIGMGLASGDAATPIIAVFYAAHHLLVKGTLFLAIDAVPARRRVAWPWLAVAAIVALSLAGLPLTGGALAKDAAKGVVGDGVMAMLAVASSVATSMLMVHFLRRLANATQASVRGTATWLFMAVACVVVPWWLYLAIPIGTSPAALAPAALWASLWPVLVGGALAWAWARVAHAGPSLPAGDIGIALVGIERAGRAIAVALERCDTVARRWQVASVALLLIAAAFYWTLRV